MTLSLIHIFPADRVHITTMDNWETFDEQIRNAGEIDAMLIGLGFDGHFCSNCPRSVSYTHLDVYKRQFQYIKIVPIQFQIASSDFLSIAIYNYTI